MTTQRNYEHIDKYLNELAEDVYAQPEDAGHTQMAMNVLNNWITGLSIKDVLDIGCGASFMRHEFEEMGAYYVGIALGDDVRDDVREMDMSFLDYGENQFDLVWARHVLEHSPMPLLTLMEWHRVSNHWLCLIMPNPDYYTAAGRNHYSVFSTHHIAWLLRRAGWKIIQYEKTEQEYRFLCAKEPRIGYEGYADIPLSNAIHEYERETFK